MFDILLIEFFKRTLEFVGILDRNLAPLLDKCVVTLHNFITYFLLKIETNSDSGCILQVAIFLGWHLGEFYCSYEERKRYYRRLLEFQYIPYIPRTSYKEESSIPGSYI